MEEGRKHSSESQKAICSMKYDVDIKKSDVDFQKSDVDFPILVFFRL